MNLMDIFKDPVLAQQLIVFFAGLILASFIWHFVGSIFRDRSWRKHNIAKQLDIEREHAREVLDHLITLHEKRIYRMRLLSWSLGAEKVETDAVEKHLEEYRKILYEWNSTINRNIALVQLLFGHPSQQTVHALYAQFQQVGSLLEACYRTWKSGDTKVDTTIIDAQLDILSNKSGALSFDMVKLIQDGTIGFLNPETHLGEREHSYIKEIFKRIVNLLIWISSIRQLITQSRAWVAIQGLDEPYEVGKIEGATQEMQVIIEAGSAAHFHRDPEFTSLGDAIAQLDPDLFVQIPPPEVVDPSRRKVTWWELIYIYVAPAALYLLPKIRDAAIKWAIERLKDEIKKREGAKGRPKRIQILGPNGEVLASVVVKSPDEAPEDLMEENKGEEQPVRLILPKSYRRKRKLSDRLLDLFKRQ